MLSAVISRMVIKFGTKLGTMDIPSRRSSHNREIPKGGGLGIFAVFLPVCLILHLPMTIWLSGCVIALISFWGGDKQLLSAFQRLCIHFGCSLLFLFFFFHSRQADWFDYWLCLPLSVFIVGTANFYNFMDGIDGIAGITGFVGFAALGIQSWMAGGQDSDLATLSLAMAFACLGFLCFNLPRARIFMGDVGSILVGFIFSCLLVAMSKTWMDFWVMAGFMAPFYFDELSTMAIRIKEGDSLIKPHRKHVYQLLANEGGIAHWKIAAGYGLMQLLTGFSAVLAEPFGLVFLSGIYFFYGILFVVFSIHVRRAFPFHEN